MAYDFFMLGGMPMHHQSKMVSGQARQTWLLPEILIDCDSARQFMPFDFLIPQIWVSVVFALDQQLLQF